CRGPQLSRIIPSKPPPQLCLLSEATRLCSGIPDKVIKFLTKSDAKNSKVCYTHINRLLQPEPRQLKGGSSWQGFQSSGALGILIFKLLSGLGFRFRQ